MMCPTKDIPTDIVTSIAQFCDNDTLQVMKKLSTNFKKDIEKAELKRYKNELRKEVDPVITDLLKQDGKTSFKDIKQIAKTLYTEETFIYVFITMLNYMETNKFKFVNIYTYTYTAFNYVLRNSSEIKPIKTVDEIIIIRNEFKNTIKHLITNHKTSNPAVRNFLDYINKSIFLVVA